MGVDPRVGSGVVGGCVAGLSVCRIRSRINYRKCNLFISLKLQHFSARVWNIEGVARNISMSIEWAILRLSPIKL
jgi:hypothetical protein